MKKLRGFTLIELLVVIAIIGILSAVVLASLNTARSRGNDASIQSNLSTVRVQAETYYGSNTASPNTYVGLCTESTVARAIAGAEAANGAGTVVCNVTGTTGVAYAVSSTMSANTALFWCVDSLGVARSSGTALGTGLVCP